ncbi:unnamed protein product, partial [Brenthis ino]
MVTTALVPSPTVRAWRGTFGGAEYRAGSQVGVGLGLAVAACARGETKRSAPGGGAALRVSHRSRRESREQAPPRAASRLRSARACAAPPSPPLSRIEGARCCHVQVN